MKHHEWADQIIRAAAEPDGEVMAAMVAHLEACGVAKTIMRSKGYGKPGSDVASMARQVPKCFWS